MAAATMAAAKSDIREEYRFDFTPLPCASTDRTFCLPLVPSVSAEQYLWDRLQHDARAKLEESKGLILATIASKSVAAGVACLLTSPG